MQPSASLDAPAMLDTVGQTGDAPDGVMGDSDLSLVPYTSRLLCAMRAIDVMRSAAPLIDDPLAVHLAGQQALDSVGQKMDQFAASERSGSAHAAEEAAPNGSGPTWMEAGSPARSYGAARARLIDDCVSATLASWRQAAPAAGGTVPKLQVVCVGAGMDTRPWRLRGAEGVAWFDVDFAEVLDLKRRLLVQAGAQVDETQDGIKYPLKVATWTPVSANLLEADAEALLTAAGFQPKLLTVWIAEGLLMYLTPEADLRLLGAARTLSAPGSVLLATHVQGAWLETLRRTANGEVVTEEERLPFVDTMNDDELKAIGAAMLSSAGECFGDADCLAKAGWRLSCPPQDVGEMARELLGVQSIMLVGDMSRPMKQMERLFQAVSLE